MKIYLCYDVSYDHCDTHRDLQKIFDCEVKAQLWVDETDPVYYDDIAHEWREYEEKEVE